MNFVNVREEWGTLNEVAPGIFRLRLFNPRGALLINTWIVDDAGLHVVDAGWPWTRAGLEAALQILGGSIASVRTWVYTHSHVDHMGLAAMLSQVSQAPQVAPESLTPHLEAWHAFQDRMNDWSAWGEEALAEPYRSRVRQWHQASRASRKHAGLVDEFGPGRVENFHGVGPGGQVTLGTRTFDVIDACGHDPHHVAYFEAASGVLFSGDVVLATPTPISRAMEDDLGAYEASVERLAALPVRMLCPGHGVQRSERIAQAFERARGFVQETRAGVQRALAGQASLDVYSIALTLTPNGQPLDPPARWWVLLSNVDSELFWGVEGGVYARDEGPRYRLV